jgi:hypothetical protein
MSFRANAFLRSEESERAARCGALFAPPNRAFGSLPFQTDPLAGEIGFAKSFLLMLRRFLARDAESSECLVGGDKIRAQRL